LSSKWRFIELDEIKDTVYTFKVAEVHKGRCRVVHSCKINDGCKEQAHQPPPITLHSFEEVNKILADADFVSQFDARSMYDQWGLDEEVGKYFVFKEHCDELAALRAQAAATHVPTNTSDSKVAEHMVREALYRREPYRAVLDRWARMAAFSASRRESCSAILRTMSSNLVLELLLLLALRSSILALKSLPWINLKGGKLTRFSPYTHSGGVQ
jgi:hypothetical protein